MQNSKTTWLILANTVKANIYKINGKAFTLLETLEHPESRLKSIDLTTDRSGRYKTDHSTHGAFVPAADHHEENHQQFAKEIAQVLETNFQQNKYQNLILCAEPHFYGLLNQVISQPVRQCVVRTIEKDYIPFPEPKMNSTIETIIQETNISHL